MVRMLISNYDTLKETAEKECLEQYRKKKS